jgi:glyoxylase-like metal-dependent hydrolase (beta-lactamase superfamily II)
VNHARSSFQIIPFDRGPVSTIGYLVADVERRCAVVIDVPFGSAEDIGATVTRLGLEVTAILLTHGHWDHTGEARRLAMACGAPVLMHGMDEEMLVHPASYGFPLSFPLEGMQPNGLLGHGDTVDSGSLHFDVLHVPGHTPGHLAFHEAVLGIIFTGDTLFHGSIGRTDLPGGSYDALMQSIVEGLLRLRPETVVYPGHGPATTIGDELTRNPFVQEYLEHF